MDGFSDLFEDIRKQGGHLVWATQKKEGLITTGKERGSTATSSSITNTPNRRLAPKRTSDQLKQDVLQSARLRHVIDQLITKNPALKREDIEREAKSVLDEMAHNFDMKYVRLLGYILMKVFSRIFSHVYYNASVCAELQELTMRQHRPVVLLPLHRSYMDFIMVSILCYHVNVPLPAVAAGQDFLGLSFMAQMLRGCGAFFIRRSFGSDELYWALFHQYVQEHLLNAERPVEFFVEGTRSRTNKSLPPKQGMLATCLELFYKNRQVDDVCLVPISVTYDRMLEELLYANELLGIPKPKETVGGLVKARAILKQSYGAIIVNFCRPVSLRDLIQRLYGAQAINRHAHTLTPRFVFELDAVEHKHIEAVSYSLLIDMLRNQVIQPVSLLATCLLVAPSRKLRLSRLCSQVIALKRLLENLGVKIYWWIGQQQQEQNDDVIEENLKLFLLENIHLHSNIFALSQLNQQQSKQSQKQPDENALYKSLQQKNSDLSQILVTIKCPLVVASASTSLVDSTLFESAALHIAMCSYRNQLVHFLVRVSFACLSFLVTHQQQEHWFDTFAFLCSLFNKEFIFHHPHDLVKDFADSVNYLKYSGLLKASSSSSTSLEINKFNWRQFLFFIKVFRPFLNNYERIYAVVLELNTDDVKRIQKSLFERLKADSDRDYEVLSLNLISNTLQTLKQFNILAKSGNKTSIDTSKLRTTVQHQVVSINKSVLEQVTRIQDELRNSSRQNNTSISDDSFNLHDFDHDELYEFSGGAVVSEQQLQDVFSNAQVIVKAKL